ncbi:hypothetical protein AURDEDRAFT_110826 [Auricularia subglabra TFB-10046 SS5]|nr:hypothetical protein AURDEDRAFT_110826 [Auricularia subglabra TFB-10046 SS5]
MSSPTIDPLALATEVIDAAKKLASDLDNAGLWTEVQLNSRRVADNLRTKGPADHHTVLGKTELPNALANLLALAYSKIDGLPRSSEALAAVYELLRIGANLCMDHDGNRQILLDNGVPQAVVGLLKSYSHRLPYDGQTYTELVSIPDLQVLRTAIGLLLNASLGYEPVRNGLINEGAPTVTLALLCTLYRPLDWVRNYETPHQEDVAAFEERWKWRSGIANWASRFISEFTEQDTKKSFALECLPYLIGSIRAFTPPHPEPSPGAPDKVASRHSLIEADVDVLDLCSGLLEALSLDVPPVLGAIGASALSTSKSTYLHDLVEFIENGNYPSIWAGDSSAKQHEKTLDLCKAAVIKTIVAAAGDEQNLDAMWQETAEGSQPQGWFVSKMVDWIQRHADGTDGWAREDLTICAALSLGNLARRESICDSLAQPPISVAAKVLPFLTPKTDLKIKHAVLGLLKNVSHAQRTRIALGDAGIIEALAASRIWTREGDFAEVVQLSAIGVAKHLSTNLDNALRLVLPELPKDADPSQPAPASGMELILALVTRSDNISIKSEGTRVLATNIKTLYTAEGDASVARRRRQAIDTVTTFDAASSLAALLCRSRKFPILLNEAVLAMTLLAHHSSGASYVLHALTTSLADTHPSPSTTSTSLTSPISPTGTALDMLQIIINNEDGKFPPELRANVCSLFGAVGKKLQPTSPGGDEDMQVGRLKGPIVAALQSVAVGTSATADDEKSTILRASAQKALETWQ